LHSPPEEESGTLPAVAEEDSEFPPDSEVDFGCDYCADGSYRWYGHVTLIASNDDRNTWLLRCPYCGVLYEHTQPRGTRPDQKTHRG